MLTDEVVLDFGPNEQLMFALMQGNREAISRLNAAGAKANKGWMVEAMRPRPAGSRCKSHLPPRCASGLSENRLDRGPDPGQA